MSFLLLTWHAVAIIVGAGRRWWQGLHHTGGWQIHMGGDLLAWWNRQSTVTGRSFVVAVGAHTAHRQAGGKAHSSGGCDASANGRSSGQAFRVANRIIGSIV